MNIHYTGKLGTLTPAQERKLQARYTKLGKILDRDKEAHVFLATEKRGRRAEITVNYYDHQLVGSEIATDGFTALTKAIDKLEKQLIKSRAKWRDTHRGSGVNIKAKVEEEMLKPVEKNGPRVFRVTSRSRQKPMSMDEAIVQIGAKRDYMVYRDIETGNISVLLRRSDGNFDLVET
jgi:putative sigma-54 modulation protein